ncbi:hypothetical protein KH5H1_32850 [Corallococcus caeni]|nr:hypothetical protein KH5H1_32850 [Corallococcus sp. KH5-1]
MERRFPKPQAMGIQKGTPDEGAWTLFRETFPRLDTTFREFSVETFSEEEDVLLDLAAGGATLGELLASTREAPLFALDGRPVFEPIPRPAPPDLTADDLYLYSKLSGSQSIRQALRTAAMGELAPSRSVERWSPQRGGRPRRVRSGELERALAPGLECVVSTNPDEPGTLREPEQYRLAKVRSEFQGMGRDVGTYGFVLALK